ncbi:hybrid sensor histidine kinase/response regulator [Nocardioides sp. AX2bis]|uniref:hybrid sensor histidine kinase/response regulator n=1 Tax=Nocardioides sp. AX2bis TaxID=2653157 RepID=UPI0012F430AC|nr:hybrid sensor histidine kinase/response regulator [Nocardioides sp. AX2bis]VXC28371.1 His Kinase A (Phospho-acceptor) domain-containing protein [Nocardioides sp. AX2bis]
MNTAAPARAPRVVVIDDTDDLRQLLSLALTRGGFEIVAEAGDGRAGIETVREHRPDVVLLDLAMPVMDGIEALPAIRRLVPSAKIIVLSGFGAQQMSARAVAVGADGYVQKGAPLPSILDYVRTVCAAPAGRSGRALSVVPDATAVDSDRVEPATDTDPAERASGSSEALALAPFGVLELADEPLFRILTVNAVAQRLLGPARPGNPLAVSAPELASMVSYHRLDADASFDVELVGGRARATIRRTGWSVLVYLDSSREDVGVLRRAISTAAQQVRGPVAVLGAIAETLLDEDGAAAGPATSEDRDRWVAAVLRQTRALDGITADLLTSAQIQRGTMRVDLVDVDAAAVARRVAAEHDLSVAGSGSAVTVVVEDNRAVRADPVRLAQALRTLLSNAHLHGEQPVAVRVRPDAALPDRVVVDVIDHGPGVGDDLVERVFTEFTRGKEGASGGTGLGLYIVRTLLLAMGGEATCGTGPEGGAVFSLHLPAVDPAKAPATTAPTT